MARKEASPVSKRQRPVRAIDVARAVGVSTATVSLGLRNNSQISLRTRGLVQAMAAKMNYRPQAAPRAMRSGRTHTIGVLFAYQPFLFGQDHGASLIAAFSQALQGVGETLAQRHYHMSFAPLLKVTGPADEIVMPRMFLESSVDGIVVIQPPTSSMHRSLEDIGIPYVVLDGPPGDGVFSVSVDEARLADMAIEYLVELGHRRIVYVQGESSLPDGTKRVHRVEQFSRGYALGMAKAGLPATPDWELNQPTIKYLESLWKQDERPTALLTYDGIGAIEAIQWLIKQGLSVPEDVSVVALHHTNGLPDTNGLPAWKWPLIPALTCKANMQMAMAKVAVEKLLYLVSHPNEKLDSVVLDPKLIVRESTGPCPSS